MFNRFWSRPPQTEAGLTIMRDGEGWILDWISRYLHHYLLLDDIPNQLSLNASEAERQVLHFTNRYQCLQDIESYHRSNRIVMTWYHGKRDNPNEPLQGVFSLLARHKKRIDMIITSTEVSRQTLLSMGIPAKKIVIIPIGVDTSEFRPPNSLQVRDMREKLDIPEDAFVIGSFQKDGNGWEEGDTPKLIKGPDIWLETLAKVKKQIPNLFVLLTGPARGYIKNGLDALSIPYRHENLLDYLSVVEYYYALDLYLISARDEGGPAGLMESWATGVPVVSTDMGMPAEWATPGENALLAPVEDSEALAQAVIKLYQDPILRKKMVQAGYEQVQALDWRILTQQTYAQVYQPLLMSMRS
ncbi:hypothetical protein MASR2M15_24270 [Anaerolineales bacterium]